MSRPLLYDLFSGAGGAAKGYEDAGFRVVGIDHEPQPRYAGSEFIRMDAFEFLRRYLAGEYPEAACFHASPPCQHYANVTRWRGSADAHPDLIPATRRALEASGASWIIENVPGAPARPDYILCGSHFGLRIRRHRWFETSWGGFSLMPQCRHTGLLPFEHRGERAYADAMGCTWMTNREAREAIPPAYTRYIGDRLRRHLEGRAA